VLIPGGLQVTLDPRQEPEAWVDPVDGGVLDLDDDLRVFCTLAQAVQLRDSIDRMIDRLAEEPSEQAVTNYELDREAS
jgi:hypothetical protein